MTIKKFKNAGKLILSVSGSLDASTAPELEETLTGALDGVTELAFDLKDLNYISSSGLRVLLFALKTMKTQGSMKVINVSEEVMEIFDITGFNEILSIR